MKKTNITNHAEFVRECQKRGIHPQEIEYLLATETDPDAWLEAKRKDRLRFVLNAADRKYKPTKRKVIRCKNLN